MPLNSYADDLTTAVRYALETTRAITACPFHRDVTIRVGDDAAESHALERAKRITKSDGTNWSGENLRDEMSRQLTGAADGACPKCAGATARGSANPA